MNTGLGRRLRTRACSQSANRTGFTVLELLVTMTVIGVMAALLLPALGAARESGRRVQCVDRLREVGLAMHNHHESRKQLPAGWMFDPSEQSAFGWAVPLLPYLGKDALAQQIDGQKTVGDPAHDLARATSLEIMLCPSDITEPTFVLYRDMEGDDDDHASLPLDDGSESSDAVGLMELPTANYVGVFGTLEADDTIPAPVGDGTFLENRRTRFRDFQRGLSNTTVVGERMMAQVPSTWLGVSLKGEDAAFRLVGSTMEGINKPFADEGDFSSRHPGGANFLWGDGHVSFVTESIDLYEYHRSARLRRSEQP